MGSLCRRPKRGHGHRFKIAGVAALTESAFYLARNTICILEVAYFPKEKNYSPYKLDCLEKHRFTTPAESLDYEYAKQTLCQ